MSACIIRPVQPADEAEVQRELRTHWGTTEIWSLGRRYHADQLPGFVAERGGAFVGLITLSIAPGAWQCEVITLSSRSEGIGVGGRLLAAGEAFAREHGCRRIYLTTTNDNTHAMRFYQRQGWQFAALHKGIVDRLRIDIPSYPTHGLNGLPIRDELEFEKWLTA